jgi:microsomal dipeptidase-like Zn-dependent dipeptidase
VRKWLQGAGIVVVIGVALFFWFGANLERFVNRVDAFVLPGVSDEARAIHDDALVVDLHADSLLFERDLATKSDVGHVDLPRLREGGVALQMFTAATRAPFAFDIHETDASSFDILTLGFYAQRAPMAGLGPRGRALHQARRLQELIDTSEGRLLPVRTRAELDAAIAAHREDDEVVGAIFGLEGAHALEGEIENLQVLFDAGVRMIGLTHFFDNELAGSAHGIQKGGLTNLGQELVTRMEAMGVAVDLAHLSPAAIDDVLAIAKKPPLVSHTGVRATCDSPRNLSDEHIRAIADAGGVIGIGYFELAICDIDPAAVVAAMKHVIDLVGDEHVALGSDYDGGTEVAFDTSQLRALTQQMLDDGLPEASIRKILGENAIRVLRRTLPRR